MSLEGKISSLREEFSRDLLTVSSSRDIENIHLKYLSKKGLASQLMLDLKNIESSIRPQIGKLINELKDHISSSCQDLLSTLQKKEQLLQFETERIDPTLPGKRLINGRIHPIQQVLDHVLDIFVRMGFSVQTGPEVDSDYYNFGALNFPKDHPARDMQDTFYIDEETLLRTHTTNVQVRLMEDVRPPLRVVSPGRVFRNETISSRSHMFFHQADGLYIDSKVSFADLLATLDLFLSQLFGEKITTRFRPSYFPFVEPGLEVDVKCTRCKGAGCRLCKNTGWLEILGAGMIHPTVLKNGNIDPEKYSGFAWGMGIERLAILFFDVSDIRLFTENDLRFLSQFNG